MSHHSRPAVSNLYARVATFLNSLIHENEEIVAVATCGEWRQGCTTLDKLRHSSVLLEGTILMPIVIFISHFWTFLRQGVESDETEQKYLNN